MRYVSRVVASLIAVFLAWPAPAPAQPAPIALTIPAQFSIQLPATQPSACWRVPRPADGLLTAEVVGAGEWSVCIGDRSCPSECTGMLRRASTEALTQGADYFVRVHSLTPGTAGTLRIYPTSSGPGAAPPPPRAGTGAAMVGRWTYHSGGFTDVHDYAADGTVSSPNSAQAHATWSVEGQEVVSRWHNQWQNRVAIPAAGSDRVSGVAISPQGERLAITLVRQDTPPVPPSPSPDAQSIVGTWQYQSGSFTDVHRYHADGTITAPNSPEAGARWRIDGNEVVSDWHNGWVNRVRLPIAGTAHGVAISPSGERFDFTLSPL